MEPTKHCRDCRALLPLDQFHKQARRSDGHGSYCKACHSVRGQAASQRWRERDPEAWRADRRKQAAKYRERHPEKAAAQSRNGRLWREYGLTPEAYNDMLTQQGGGCALCGRTDAGLRQGGPLRVDHCHETGRVRGLLCDQCNTSIGKLGDSAEALRRVVAYLEAS